MFLEILLTAAYCLVFVFVLRKSRFFNSDAAKGIPLYVYFILKCIAGITLGLLYLYYYANHADADTFKFFGDSKLIYDALWDKPYDFFRMFTGFHGKDPDLLPYYVKMDSWLNTSPLYNDNRTMIRLNALFRFFSFGHYNVHVIFINIISFTGLFCLYKVFADHLTNKKTELQLLLFLMPSLLFWGSGMLKDGLLIAAIGALIYSFHRMMKIGFSKKRFAIFLMSVIVLAFIKVYVTVLMLPGLVAWFLTRHKTGRAVTLTFISFYAVYFIVAFNLYHFKDDYNVAALLFYKQKNFIEIGMLHDATMIPALEYECSGTSIAAHAPLAIANTWFRPFMWEVHGNPMVLMSALENLLLIGLLLILFLTLDRKKKMAPLVMHSIAFVICLFALIGLITPVLGAIVRYRIIALPFMIFVMLYFYDKEKLLRFYHSRFSSKSKK